MVNDALIAKAMLLLESPYAKLHKLEELIEQCGSDPRYQDIKKQLEEKRRRIVNARNERAERKQYDAVTSKLTKGDKVIYTATNKREYKAVFAYWRGNYAMIEMQEGKHKGKEVSVFPSTLRKVDTT